MQTLLEYSWPGNVRELENAVERAKICSRGAAIEESALPAEIRRRGAGTERTLGSSFGQPAGEEAERLRDILSRCQWNRRKAAAKLGISRVTLWRKMKSLGFEG
jgi:transcriptional regulator of acetoin/glycerol metabolism